MSDNPHSGSLFDDFLKEDGLYDECSAAALKSVLARQIQNAMKSQKLTKSAMAERMHTSRSQLDRLLNPDKTGVSLEIIQRAASIVGKQLRIELI